VVVAGDENRLTGYAGLPINIDPYQTQYGMENGAAAVDLPAAGTYDAVFDTRAGGKAGAFRFRFWVNDFTPPAVTLLTARVAAAAPIRLRVTDRGSGVDPHTLFGQVDGRGTAVAFDAAKGIASIATAGIPAGKHTLRIDAADYQESKNMESTGAVLPNTRTFRATFTIG
jgi:hypothetical protein